MSRMKKNPMSSEFVFPIELSVYPIPRKKSLILVLLVFHLTLLNRGKFT